MSKWLNNIPGLTGPRLGELYQAVLDVTGDPFAIAEVTHYARGGMRIEIHWHQNGMRHHYPATLPADDVQLALVVNPSDEQVFQNFATLVLDSVREMRNKLAGAEAPAGTIEPPNFGTAANQVAALVGSLRARAADPAGDGNPGESDGREVPSDPKPDSGQS